MKIVKLAPERWQEYRELRLEALKTDPEAFGASYESTLQRTAEWWIGRLQAARIDPNQTILFAEEDGRLLGMAGTYPEEEAGCVDVISMYVTPTARGKGIGRALLQSVTKEIVAKEIRLCVNATLPAAVRLYQSFGFVTIAETIVSRTDGSTYPQLFMALRRTA
jgi:GNAT superfamily N-acetyltransferase